MPSTNPQPTAKTILILAANPKGTVPLRLDEEVREIKAGLQRSRYRDQFVVEYESAARPSDVQQFMLDYEPQIIHFCGHGMGDQGLVLEDESGNIKPVSTEALANLFGLFAEKVECVLLNACYSQVQAKAIGQHIGLVIGMTQAIGDRAAIKFAVSFYNALGAGKDTGFAFNLGRIAMQLEGIAEDQTPVLISRSIEMISPKPDPAAADEMQDSRKLIPIGQTEPESRAEESLGQPLDSNSPLPSSPPQANNVDTLIQQIREHCRQKILRQHSRIRLLSSDSNEIGVDQLYVDVWLLNRSPRTYQVSQDKLLKSFDLRNDRLGLGDWIKRNPGFEIANANPKLVILGKPGSGKTTFLKHLAVDWCKGKFQSNLITVLIELRRIQDSRIQDKQWDLLDAIDQELGLGNWLQLKELKTKIDELKQKLGTEENEKEIAKLQQKLETLPLQALLKQGKLLVLMDGLDEVPTNELRSYVQKQLRQIAADYPNNRFILTCRTQIIASIPSGFTSVEVAEFSEQQIKQFVQNWFMASGRSEAEAAEQWKTVEFAIGENLALKELTVTPVLLSLMCLVLQDEGEMPSQVNWLYKKGVKLLLSKWNDNKEIEEWDLGSKVYAELSVERREALLIEIAARKFENPENFVLFNQEEIAAQITEFLQLAERREGIAVLKAIEAQHGLLIERADELWSFSHLTFQEHFTILWLTQLPTEQLAKKIASQQWQGRVKQLVKSQQPADRLVTLIKQAIDQSIAQETTLQEILIWVFKRAKTVQANYKPAAIRAAYFSRGRDPELELELASARARARARNLEPDPDPELDRDLNRDLDPDLDPDLHPNLALDRNLALALALARDLALTNDLGLALALARALDRALDRALNHALNADRELANKLEQLRARIPASFAYSRMLQQWWDVNGTQWVEQLRQAMIQYRDLGHDWQLTSQQKQRLQRYYNANRFLVELIKIGGAVSKKVHTEIEAALLLPWEELQKRSR